MAENTKISWCDRTENAWIGCSKQHTGCKNCFAESMSNNRFTGNLYNEIVWGENAKRYRVKGFFKNLNAAQRKAKIKGVKETVFVGSMMDIFEDSKPLLNPLGEFCTTDDLRQELFNRITIGAYKNLIFLFLTKRPRSIREMLPDEWYYSWENVWFGTSISDQETTKYAYQLRNSLRFQNLFLSIEPQIGNIEDICLDGISWVIQGGESGPKKRPFDISWAYKMKEICQFYGVPYFFKQIDKVQPIPKDLLIQEFPIQLKP